MFYANITLFLSVSFDQTFLFKRKVWLRLPERQQRQYRGSDGVYSQ
jgi:hypothetical protein